MVHVAQTTGRRRDAQRNRRRLMESAAQVLAARGRQASLKEVADHAGLGVGTVYRHLPDKEAVIVALLAPQLEDLRRVALEALARPDPTDAFIEMAQQAAATMADSVALAELIQDPGPTPEPLRGLVADLMTITGTVLARAQAAGGIRADVGVGDLAVLLTAAHVVEQTYGYLRTGINRRMLALLLTALDQRPGSGYPLEPEPIDVGELLAGPPGANL